MTEKALKFKIRPAVDTLSEYQFHNNKIRWMGKIHNMKSNQPLAGHPDWPSGQFALTFTEILSSSGIFCQLVIHPTKPSPPDIWFPA